MNAKHWLELELMDGRNAAAHGYSKAELRAARKELGVKTYHQFDEDGATANWFWYLEV